MKHFLLALLIFFNSFVFGQQEIEISELKTPTSPAFALLGVSPNEISRPKSLNDLEVSFMNAFYNNGGFQFPRNFALETNPSQLFRKKQEMTLEEWKNPSYGQQMWRNFSISAATSPRTDLVDTTKLWQQFSVGMRTQFYFTFKEDKERIAQWVTAATEYKAAVLPVAKIRGMLDFIEYDSKLFAGDEKQKLNAFFNAFNEQLFKNKALTEDEKTSLFERMTRIRKEVERHATAYSFSNEQEYTKAVNNILNLLKDDYYEKSGIEKTTRRLRDTYNGPQSFFVEMGTAMAWYFPEDKITKTRASRFGIWLSPTFRTNEGNKGVQGEIIGLGRFMNDFVHADSIRNKFYLDLGVRAVLKYKRASFSLEALYRSAGITQRVVFQNVELKAIPTFQSDYKVSFNVEYRITNTFSVTYSIGKDFNTNTFHQGGNLINLLGLNMGIFPAFVKMIQQ